MPFFRNKFSVRNSQRRKWPSLSDLNLDSTLKKGEYSSEPLRMELDDRSLEFVNGEWKLGLFCNEIFVTYK